MIKSAKTMILIALTATILSACQSTPVQDGAVLGGLLGAGLGAIAGNQSGHQGEGALIGAGVGALTGALVGDAVRTERHTYPQRYGVAPAPQPVVYAQPLPPAQVNYAPPAAGNAPYQREYRVVQGANGETFEREIWVDRY